MKNYLLIGFLTFYFIRTLKYAIKFNRTSSFFTKRQKLIHNILIWAIPFFWIMVLKTMMQPTPGTAADKKTKPEGHFYESEIGFLGDGPPVNTN